MLLSGMKHKFGLHAYAHTNTCTFCMTVGLHRRIWPLGRYFILVENTEYRVDLKWKRGQEASVTFSWIHQRISMSTWNPQHFLANQLSNEKTHTCPKQWLHLKFLSFETAAPVKGESVIVSQNVHLLQHFPSLQHFLHKILLEWSTPALLWGS